MFDDLSKCVEISIHNCGSTFKSLNPQRHLLQSCCQVFSNLAIEKPVCHTKSNPLNRHPHRPLRERVRNSTNRQTIPLAFLSRPHNPANEERLRDSTASQGGRESLGSTRGSHKPSAVHSIETPMRHSSRPPALRTRAHTNNLHLGRGWAKLDELSEDDIIEDWGCSSVGRALRSHRRGRGFDYHQLH